MPVPLTVFGRHDRATLQQMGTCLATGSAAAGVLCADGHLGYNHPIGGVVGYEDDISISGVGFDIACGNKALRLDTRFDDIALRTDAILRDIARNISFGMGRANKEKVDDPLFDSDLWQAHSPLILGSSFSAAAASSRIAPRQPATSPRHFELLPFAASLFSELLRRSG